MRVLFYNANRSRTFGGIEHWMLDVSMGLMDRGHHAVLYGRECAGWFQEAGRRGLPRVTGLFGMDFHPAALRRLYTALRTHEIDVVFAKGKKGTRLAAAATRLTGHGAVVLVLGLEGELKNRAADRWTWRYAVDRGMVLAEEARLWYERFPWAADGKLYVLLKGVDVEALDPHRVDGLRARAELGIPATALVVGTVGRLVWQKGHVFLLQAAGRLRDRLPQARYLLVGGGEEEDALRQEACRLRIEDRMIFAGYRLDVPQLLGAMDIFALPSRKENMPQVLLEAMAMARPVVSTASIGVREVLEDGVSGFVVPTGDVDAISDRILRLAQDAALREEMGARARARICAGFTREHMLSRVERLLNDVGNHVLRGRIGRVGGAATR